MCSSRLFFISIGVCIILAYQWEDTVGDEEQEDSNDCQTV